MIVCSIHKKKLVFDHGTVDFLKDWFEENTSKNDPVFLSPL